MATRRHAELLLTSPLGPLGYDVLEDAAYVGPAKRGGLTAAPNPFAEAVAVLTLTDDGFVLKALPGESKPLVDGEPTDGSPLKDGAQLEIAGEAVTFRGRAPLGEGSSASLPASRAGRSRARAPAAHRPWWITALSLGGAVLLLAAVALTIHYVTDFKADQKVKVRVPTPPRRVGAAPATTADPAGQDFDKILDWQKKNPAKYEDAITRWKEYLRRHRTSPKAGRAQTQLREVIRLSGLVRLKALREELAALLGEGQYDKALAKIRQMERQFGATDLDPEIDAERTRVREAARKALDQLLAEVGPMVSNDPKRAHRILLAAGQSFPPDLAGEITDLMERALQIMKMRGGRSEPAPRERRPKQPVAPRGQDEPKPPDGPSGGAIAEISALDQWKQAREALRSGRYEDALEGYTLLIMRYGNTDVYRENKRFITAGRYAAKVGAHGPVAMLSVPAEVKKGRIEVEYSFDDGRVLERDFSIEQPFSSEQPVRAKVEMGAVRLEGTSGLFHMMVWEPDVRIEAKVELEIAHDIGAIAVANLDDFRAIVLSLGNTRFKLKKGTGIPNPGHVLWYVGQGVWADADEGAHGYVKIAERTKVSLANGDEGTIELMRKGDRCEAGYHGRSDGVSLKGDVKGDDGKGMGSAKLGLFANTGALVVKHLKIVGKVDESWFQKRLKYLVEEDPGPKEE